MPAAQNAVLSAVAPPEIGKASGTFNMLRYLGAAFGIALDVAAFNLAGEIGSPAAFSARLALAIGGSALLSPAAAPAVLALPGRRAVALVPSTAAPGRPG